MYFLRALIFNNFDVVVGILFSYGNHYILVTNIQAQSNCIFWELWFLIFLICLLEYYFHIWIINFGYKYWRPIQLYFLRALIFNNLDLSAEILFTYGNHYIRATNIEAQSNCIFCESWVLVILIWIPGISFSHGKIYIYIYIYSGHKYCGTIQLYFCEPWFLLILICLLEYYFHMEIITFWLPILRPNPIVFSASPDFY